MEREGDLVSFSYVAHVAGLKHSPLLHANFLTVLPRFFLYATSFFINVSTYMLSVTYIECHTQK